MWCAGIVGLLVTTSTIDIAIVASFAIDDEICFGDEMSLVLSGRQQPAERFDSIAAQASLSHAAGPRVGRGRGRGRGRAREEGGGCSKSTASLGGSTRATVAETADARAAAAVRRGGREEGGNVWARGIGVVKGCRRKARRCEA